MQMRMIAAGETVRDDLYEVRYDSTFDSHAFMTSAK